MSEKKTRLRLTALYQTNEIEVSVADHVLRGVSLIQAVEATGHGVMIDETTLQAVVELGNASEKGIKSRFTHPGLSSDGLGKFLGRIRGLRVEGDKVIGDLYLSSLAFNSPTDGNLGDYILERAAEDPASFGLSIVADGSYVWRTENGAEIDAGESPRPTNSIHDLPFLRVDNLVACDVVDEPAANRDGVFSGDLWASNKDAEEVYRLIDEEMARQGVSPARAYQFALSYFGARGVEMKESGMGKKENGQSFGSAQDKLSIVDDQLSMADGGVDGGISAKPNAGASAVISTSAADDSGHEEMRAQLAALEAQLHARDINDLIGGSGLSEVGQRVVSGAVTDLRADASLETVQTLIERQREAEAALAERQAVKGVGPDVARGSGTQIGSMRNSLDKIALAVDGLIGGVDPGEGVKPLSGIRELYTLLTGDYEFTGLFQPERVEFANVTSATMAGLVADALNKRVINQFQVYDRFWEPLVHVEDFTTLQSVKWITLGGVGELPTVSEGAAYSEMTWDDQTETSQWLKKGGYLGLTLEAIDKDDTRRLQQAPRALAQSAWMTLGKAFTSVFTGSGTMSDGKTLFHADHSNLGSTALGYPGFEATRTAMAAQTELNSGEPLGGLTMPRYLMVPRGLEGTALQVLGTEGEPGTANNDENPWANGDGHDARMAAARRRVIPNDFLTDTNDWYALADPRLYPSVGLGYRFGRMPQIVSVADERVGLMFTNDVMPIKVRFLFAIGPTDWRGVYKNAVS